MERGRVVWSPAEGAWRHSQLAEFAASSGCGDDTYAGLLAWSLEAPDEFWTSLAAWAGVRWHDEPTTGLARATMPGASWFPGGTLNYAEHALAAAASTPGAVAVVERSQTRARRELTWATLTEQVTRCRTGLRQLGVGRGDRVVAFAPNTHETLVAFLATASLGAVWSSCAPEFGVRAVTDRWTQIEPAVLLAVDGYRYGHKRIDRRAETAAIVDALPTLRHVVAVPYLEGSFPPPPSCRRDVGWHTWAELVTADTASHTGDASAEPLTFEAVPFDHPLYVLFSSGTTGLPKPIVHGHGGITLEHLKALRLHYDLRPGVRFMWFTTTGWMMWNFLVSGLLAGSTVVLFDGDPGWPDLGELWRVAADEHLEVLGVSAPFLMACRKAGMRPGDEFDLARLRHVGSTGAPLPAEGFEWVIDAVGAHVQPGSMSGGTDVCTAFVGPTPVTPVRAGEITTRMLGCDVRAFRPDGTECSADETGELVITTPLPSMPVALWGDPDGSRLRATYFAEFPGVWHHGDWIAFHDDGACRITGRSDATLNRGGVRLGTSDFYTAVEQLPGVADSLVVHVEDEHGGMGELVLFVACAPGHHLDDELRARIGQLLREELSPRHVPDVIEEVPAVPRTLSGKKLEVPVKRLLLGAPPDTVAARDALADPAALDAVAEFAARRQP